MHGSSAGLNPRGATKLYQNISANFEAIRKHGGEVEYNRQRLLARGSHEEMVVGVEDSEVRKQIWGNPPTAMQIGRAHV